MLRLLISVIAKAKILRLLEWLIMTASSHTHLPEPRSGVRIQLINIDKPGFLRHWRGSERRYLSFLWYPNLFGARLLTALMLFLFSQSAYATTISQIESYLNSLHNITADFVQIDSGGKQQKGRFFLSRPGKMRWQYETPRKTLLIINDKTLIYYDHQLDQLSYFKNKEDHLAWLTAKTINLRKLNAHLEQAGADVYLTIPKTKHRGEIRLIFSQPKLKLIGFEVIDSGRESLLINFINLKESVSLDGKLFQFSNELRNKIP